MQIRAYTERRVLVGMTSMLLALAPTLAWGDFDELPLAPLVSTPEEEEEEEIVPVEEEAPVVVVEEPDAAEEIPPPPPSRPSSPATEGALAVIVTAGTYLPLSTSVPFGMELGAAIERPLGSHGVCLRFDASWSSHRLGGARLFPGMGLDEGFAEVANLFGLRAGAAWRPMGPASGPYLHAGLGGLLSLNERRLFSVESRTTFWRPVAALGVGFDLHAGPGRLRLETALRALHLPMGPEGAPVVGATVGASLALAYRIDI